MSKIFYSKVDFRSTRDEKFKFLNDIKKVLTENGITASIITRLSPPWTTDWMSNQTLEKLRVSGIAPPRT